MDASSGLPASATSAFSARWGPASLALGHELRISSLRTSALSREPSEDPQTAFVQLLEQLRSCLIANLSYELQTPLSTIQVALETLTGPEGEGAALQAQMLSTALADLRRLCQFMQTFLASAQQVWRMTKHCLVGETTDRAPAELTSMFADLLDPNSVQQWRIVISHADGLPLALLEQMQSSLMAVVNHEIRTPLASMQVCLESLQEQFSLPEDNRQGLLAVALADVERLRRLSSDLLFLYRLQSDQVGFRVEPVDIGAVLHTTLSSFQRRSPDQPMIEWDAAVELPVVWVDGDRLVEVIGRLLDNARRFTPAGGRVRVQARLVCSEAGSLQTRDFRRDLQLVMCVSDTGRGIAVEQLAHIFDGFYQAEDYLCRTQSGLGIGLTICRRLVEGMGGTIWAESTGLGQGSQFFFSIPVVSEQAVLID